MITADFALDKKSTIPITRRINLKPYLKNAENYGVTFNWMLQLVEAISAIKIKKPRKKDW